MDKRFLIISSEYPPGPGGIGQHAFSLSKSLSKYGHVRVLSNQDYATIEEKSKFNESIKNSIELTPFNRGIKGLKPFKNFSQVLNEIKKNEPSLIIATGRIPLIMAGLLKRLNQKLNVIGFAHGSEITTEGGVLTKLTTLSCVPLNEIFAVSEYTKKQLEKSISRPIKVLPNGLDQDYLYQTNSYSLKYEWKGSPKLLTVGNTTPRKGQHNVIKALPLLKSVYPDVHYHIVGLETGRNALEELASELGVFEQVTFHGRLPSKEELIRAYNSCDIFVMLSENQPNGDVEGFGIALLEANALNKPSIGSKGCGIEDAISKHSGLLINPLNPQELLSSVNEILGKAKLNTGPRLWAEKHNWDNLINELLNE